MAGAVVGALIGKLDAAVAKEAATYGASLLYKDASALKGLFGEICRAERELESMKTYLRESEKFMDTDETISIFIKTIRELSFRIEDVVDEFMYKLHGNKHGGFAARIKKKSYKVENLLKKICTEFNVPVDSSIMDMRRLVYAIRRHLEGKRFILVLDDVWEKEVWINNIMPVFPANCTSRFVLTSRLSEVASLASSNCAIELKPLQGHHSYMLFCKLAFWDNDDKRCPPELSDLATKFLQKCEELQSVRNTIPGVETILKVSLEDLPYELKNCFLHCAIFPEDYKLKRRRLIRHWITSGFIKKKENKTLEQVAEGYLNDLVNRSLLQVVMNNEFGRVKCCRMHDVIRHIAIEKAEKECFGQVYEGNWTFLVHPTRRLSIQSTNIELLNLSSATHLRQIHVSTRFVDIDRLRPILSSSVLLSTLDLQGTEIKVLPNEIFSLFNLRFLGLRNTKMEVLPEAIGRLANLEVTEGSFSRNHGVKMPRGIKNLTGLHALQNVKATSETLCDVAALIELRTFSVDDVTCEHSLILRNALLKMSNLVSLSITTMSNENESFPRLKELRVWCAPQLNRVEIEEDARGSLAKLWFVECPELKRLPHGLKYLAILDELHLVNTAVELIELANECEEELMKISHIRKFTIISNEKNFTRRIVSSEGNEFAC
ncbi:unnamed protein product [Miscanthus lutarioriparius]|uniref:NB-ARC domain-containing protein n=1 Tax=Miscanthus lutarioriparius TaxID=422564 RepID=A0A811Q5I5_9POAL|nr:unnamed protein product [Miscanthus lutarioriparius]